MKLLNLQRRLGRRQTRGGEEVITSKLMKYAIAVLFVIGLCACDHPRNSSPNGLEASPFATIPTNSIGLGYSGLTVTNTICIGVGAGLYNTQFCNLLLLGRDIEPTDHNQIVIRGMSGKIYRYPLEFLIPEPVDFGDMGIRLEPKPTKPTGRKSVTE